MKFMRSKIILSCLLILLLTRFNAVSQILWQITENKVTQWDYLDGDEFNGTVVDTSMWRDSYPWGRSLFCSLDKHYYTEFKNCKIENGILSLTAKQEKIKARAIPYENDDYRLVCDGKDVGVNFQTFDYTCGMIFSNRKYHYGVYEIRFRSQEGKGIWPAFWLYAGHENDEIDIFEMNGSRNTELHVDVHCKNGCKNYKTTLGLARKNWGDYLKTSTNWKDGYNVISIEWQPEYIKWFLNGNAVAYWKGKFDYPMWLIADIAIARDGGPFGPGPDASTKFPASFDIDYIRVWTSQTSTSAKSQQEANLELPKTNSPTNKAVLIKGTQPESKKKVIRQNQTFVLFAKAPDNNYFIEISGSVPTKLSIEVIDSSGNAGYKSTDVKKSIHEFKTIGKGTIKIKLEETQLEHSF